MTSIEYSRNEQRHELSIIGHACYDMEGRDIVCSAISGIAYALLGFLANNASETSDYASQTDSGALLIRSLAGDEKIDAAFEMAVIGLAQIAKDYPDYVQIQISATGGDAREETAF